MNTTGTEDLLDALDEYPPMSDEELQAHLASSKEKAERDAENRRNLWLRLQKEFPAIEK